MSAHDEEQRFRSIFRSAHADHATCADDEWLDMPCRLQDGTLADRPLVWSRRNGPWRRVPILWVGAAPGNAGGLGSSDLGAHGTRIPFGGDIAGANLDVLLSSIGTSRNETFIVASLNQLPLRGGGEPTLSEMAEPVGAYGDSIALLRDTVIATGPALLVALGNVALRATAAALTRPDDAPVGEPRRATPGGEPRPAEGPQRAPLRLPTLARLNAAGLRRGAAAPWPVDALPVDAGFEAAWRAAWRDGPALRVLPLLHPSAQNMSPFAGTATLFHQRMVSTRDALVESVQQLPGTRVTTPRPQLPDGGIYELPEWRERIAERHRRLDELWRERGV
jgi:uracil-DNA glycosylase